MTPTPPMPEFARGRYHLSQDWWRRASGSALQQSLVRTENLNPDVVVMKSAKDRM